MISSQADPAEPRAETGYAVCQPRGYCGPFINRHVYDAFPDPLWHGMGECAECGSTAHAEREEEKRRTAEGRRFEAA